MSLTVEIGQLCLGLDALRALRAPLFEGAASLDQQLAALGRSSSAGSNLPTTAQLQAAWAALVVVHVPAELRHGLPQAELAAFREQAARALLALQPDNPRSSYELGNAAVTNVTCSSASRLRDPLPHFQHGRELARAQGSDFWLARWAGCRGELLAGGVAVASAAGLMAFEHILLTPHPPPPTGVAG